MSTETMKQSIKTFLMADVNNKFIEISITRQTVGAVATAGGAVLLNGRNVKATKIMLYRRVWMTTFYHQPLEQARARIIPARATVIIRQVPARQRRERDCRLS